MKRENEHKEYCEQDIVDQISRMSEDTEVPDSLRSENIDKLLEKKKQKKHFRPYQIGLVQPRLRWFQRRAGRSRFQGKR